MEESIMSFDRSWVLFIAWIPLAWMVLEWRRTVRHLGLALKAFSLAFMLLALAEPRLATHETKVAVAVLVDTSASVSTSDLDRASQLAGQMSSGRGRNWMQVIPFARSTRELKTSEDQAGWKLQQTSGDSGRATDIEAAVGAASAALPSGLVPRIALISDGLENKGSLARAAWQAQQLGIPIDTFAMSGRPQPALRLESVSVPSIAFTGEQFPIDVVVSAPSAVPAEIELTADGKPLGKTQVQLASGINPVTLHASLNTAGALDLSIAIRAGNLGEVHFDQAVRLRRPRLLYVSQDSAEQDPHLPSTLTAAQFDITRASDLSSAQLTGTELLVLSNIDLEALPTPQKEQVETFVKNGGGLLVIAGEHNVYVEGKTQEDALDRTLPVKLAPPRSPEGTAVVLIIDKSSSMEGKKIELARQAATGVVENLRPIDMIGVLIFDNSFEWAIPIRRAEDKVMLKRMIAGIMPDGGTQIAPALAEAYKRILPTNATYKHIVLLTDGISEEGDSLDLAREANLKHVTISTVGLGQDVNRSYLVKISTNAGGKSYFLTEPQGLEQILLRDVMEHTGTTAVEKSLQAEVIKNVDILAGVDIAKAPQLKGYIRFIPKPSSEVLLNIDRKEPLLARWQYGLGRAAVWTSDAKPRWASDWIAWPGYDKLWTNLGRDLLPRAQAGEATAEYDGASGKLLVDYRLGKGVAEPATIPKVFAIGPGGFEKPVRIHKVASGTFRGEVEIGTQQGLFRVRPVEDSPVFPEVGLYRPEAELSTYGADEALLRQVAEFTGGRFQPDPRAVFEAGPRSVASSMSLWPGLLALAVLLSLTELVLRKWKGVMKGVS
jgi:uncharacterized membrane protein